MAEGEGPENRVNDGLWPLKEDCRTLWMSITYRNGGAVVAG
jgi:hypothetical protein